jgi:transmembrane sensor
MTQSTKAEIDELAARWVARMDGESWTDADDAELGRWCAMDTRHAGALLHAQALWTAIGQDDVADDAFVASGAASETSPLPVLSRRWVLGGAGAALAASFVGALVLRGSGTRYSTAVGEIRRVPLADGSTAAINTDSRIAVALAETRRSVTLEKGEAWFQVAKDAKRPFVVEAGNVRVQAVGTAFSVRRQEGGADVIVTEGVVEAWVDGTDGQKIRVTAGNMAFVADNAAVERAIVADNAPAAERALAWRSGKIDLAGRRVDEAIAEFNRYNVRQIVVRDPTLGAERVDGVFRTDDPIGFARVIAGSFDTSLDLSNPQEIRISGQ